MKAYALAFLSFLVVFSFPGKSLAGQCADGVEQTDFVTPIVNWKISAGFDEQSAYEHHLGVDATPASGAVIGTPVLAPCTGVVRFANTATHYGALVILECSTNIGCVTPFMAHMFKNNTTVGENTYKGLQVSYGAHVEAGQIVGYLADYNNNGGWAPHLHYGIRKGAYKNGTYTGCVDPGYSDPWYYAGYPHGCEDEMLPDFLNPELFVLQASAYLSTCHGPVTEDSDPETYQFFVCNNPASQFRQGQSISFLSRLEQLTKSHTYKVVYKKDGTEVGSYIWYPGYNRLEDGQTWQWSHFWRTLEGTGLGTYGFLVYIYLDEALNNPPVQIAEDDWIIIGIAEADVVPFSPVPQSQVKLCTSETSYLTPWYCDGQDQSSYPADGVWISLDIENPLSPHSFIIEKWKKGTDSEYTKMGEIAANPEYNSTSGSLSFLSTQLDDLTVGKWRFDAYVFYGMRKYLIASKSTEVMEAAACIPYSLAGLVIPAGAFVCDPCNNSCAANQVCINDQCCTPSCSGKSCGGDGCNGSCGSCSSGYSCVSGACQYVGVETECTSGECCSANNQFASAGVACGELEKVYVCYGSCSGAVMQNTYQHYCNGYQSTCPSSNKTLVNSKTLYECGCDQRCWDTDDSAGCVEDSSCGSGYPDWHPDGTLVRTDNNEEVYYLEDGQARYLPWVDNINDYFRMGWVLFITEAEKAILLQNQGTDYTTAMYGSMSRAIWKCPSSATKCTPGRYYLFHKAFYGSSNKVQIIPSGALAAYKDSWNYWDNIQVYDFTGPFGLPASGNAPLHPGTLFNQGTTYYWYDDDRQIREFNMTEAEMEALKYELQDSVEIPTSVSLGSLGGYISSDLNKSNFGDATCTTSDPLNWEIGDGGLIVVAGSGGSCYTGPDGTEGVGPCHGGTSYISSDGSYQCLDQVLPAPENCTNGIDDDCDGQTDQADTSDCPVVTTPDADGDGVNQDYDCNDSDPSVYPGASEACDEKDNDCDGQTDEGFGKHSFCDGPDADLCTSGVMLCDESGGVYCDESGHYTESCNGQDDDCDGLTDEGYGTICCGNGECRVCKNSCLNGQPQTCVPTSAAAEICDGKDNDCDGATDEGFNLGASCDSDDSDSCAYGTIACSGGQAVCAGDNPSNIIETCNGIDDDCDGQTDEGGNLCGLSDSCSVSWACVEGDCVPAQDQVDCNDGNVCTDDSCDPTSGCVHDYNNVTCDDGDPCSVEEDCFEGECVGIPKLCKSPPPAHCAADGIYVVSYVEDGVCTPGTGECVYSTISSFCPSGCAGGMCKNNELCDGVDCDDLNVCTDDSCDPATGFCKNVFNTAPCNDGDPGTLNDTCFKGDCLGGTGSEICSDDSDVTTDIYDPDLGGCLHVDKPELCGLNDLDHDGYPAGVDCDDEEEKIHPGAFDVCGNNIDDDCDGETDNPKEIGLNGSTSATGISFSCEQDADGDGWPGQMDCNDSDPSINPGHEYDECDGKDNDCDGKTDEKPSAATGDFRYSDYDADGFGSNYHDGKLICPGQCFDSVTCTYHATKRGDCDDGRDWVKPGATEVYGNLTDENCDGKADCTSCPELSWCDPAVGCHAQCAGQDWVELDTYAFTTCARSLSGLVSCWGENRFGCTEPKADQYMDIDVGWECTCGVNYDGEVKCWGEPECELGVPHSGTYKQVSVGGFACALSVDGSVRCWGKKPHSPDENVKFQMISVGQGHGCGIRIDDTLYCWGENSHGEADPPAGGNNKTVYTGNQRSCVLKEDGTFGCWGEVCTVGLPKAKFKRASLGSVHICVLTMTDKVLCIPAVDKAKICSIGLSGGDYLEVQAGNHGVCAIDEDQQIVCRGHGQNAKSKPPCGTYLQ